ncbi:MAG TPA: hypothetical protein VNK67_02470 [Burkholderiales bacterium]|nr:hypothetical protein [Burkholderiales bacterium]
MRAIFADGGVSRPERRDERRRQHGQFLDACGARGTLQAERPRRLLEQKEIVRRRELPAHQLGRKGNAVKPANFLQTP